jgi:hypothetical protein
LPGSADTVWSKGLGDPPVPVVLHTASARGGEVRLSLRGDRVRLRGQPVTILDGLLLVTG